MSTVRKPPNLRVDLKISRQVLSDRTSFVVKDPIKGEYFRFTEDEWRVISFFDGKQSTSEMVHAYNLVYPHDPIDEEVIKNFEESLDSMHLLEKSAHELNVMLIEKMKESRKSLLMSKKGSLMYKRFPIIDPDRIFDKVIPHIKFFWTKSFFVYSILTMLLCLVLVGYRFDEFQNGVVEVFSFSKLSIWNLAFLWVTIYLVIAIHELGHGLTCKFYGGEVHEIGFLLLFFQPCLYANVNDAWLFDKKWKQIMVTIAGGYIEFFVGALFGILWALTNPNTLINVLSLQVMTICSLSTVIFNFNPLVKLDGYYLLADALECPNLRELSFDYLKYFFKKHFFRMDPEPMAISNREARIYLAYGAAAFCWVTSLTLGLYTMAKGFLIEQLQGLGILASFWVAYKLFGGHVKASGMFLVQIYLKHREYLHSKNGKRWVGGVLASLIIVFAFPISYDIRGKCALESVKSTVIRASANGVMEKFFTYDGQFIKKGQKLFEMSNPSLLIDKEIAELAVRKLELQERAVVNGDPARWKSLREELMARRESLTINLRKIASLSPEIESSDGKLEVIHCTDQVRKSGNFIKEGSEICRIENVDRLKTVIEIPENEVRFLRLGDVAYFKLQSKPLMSYKGEVTRIREMGMPDPSNPKARLYMAELTIENPGELRPGMTGQAKIKTKSVPLMQFMGRKLAMFFRLDLFY